MKNISFCRLMITVTLISLLALTGCAQLKEKFIPKKKEAETTKSYYTVRKYDVRPSMELYTKRYVFWKTWHKELLETLDDSNKKKKNVAAEQAVSNLGSMHGMLVDSKAAELQVLIDQMKEIETTIKNERVTGGNEVRLKRKLETLGRAIRRDFSYNVIGDYIREDFSK